MDFNSLGAGSPFYILRQGGKPSLEIGTVKQKSQPRAKFLTQTPNLMTGMQAQQVLDIVVSVGGRDESYTEIPITGEIAKIGDVTFSGSREAMLQAVDGMIQTSRKALEQVNYHKSVLTEGEKMLETLNPQYAENKAQAKSILDLQERQDKQDKKLDSILEILKSMDKGKG